MKINVMTSSDGEEDASGGRRQTGEKFWIGEGVRGGGQKRYTKSKLSGN